MRMFLADKFHYREGGVETYHLDLGEGRAHRGSQVVESHAVEAPVVGTISEGIPELVLEEQAGFLVQPDDVHELVMTFIHGSMTSIHEAFCHDLPETCRTYVHERCSPDARLDCLEELYGGVTRAKR